MEESRGVDLLERANDSRLVIERNPETKSMGTDISSDEG
jgi:hypothetical protein